MIDTAWDLLAFPRLCLLAAQKPTRLGQAMHNAGFRALGLPFVYVACEVAETADAIASLRKLGARGMSLTIPHKENAIPFVDKLSEDGKRIGAINTVINSGTELYGYNTDWTGVRDALEESGVNPSDKRVLVFGSGGAAKAAIFALEKAGASEIFLVNRSAERAKATAENFHVTIVPFNDLAQLAKEDVTLVINATPLGSHLAESENPLRCFYASGGEAPALFEMVTRETELERTARTSGAKAIPGARMLLFQALDQFRHFTEHEPPREAMEKALYDALRSQ